MITRKIKIPIIDVKKYGGKQVAIVEGKIVAVGATLDEVIRKAKRAFPTKPLQEIRVFSVPKTLAVVYLCLSR